jgi:hypothetical protein
LKRSVTFWLAGETKSQSKLILADFVVGCVPLSDPAGIFLRLINRYGLTASQFLVAAAPELLTWEESTKNIKVC